MREFLNRSNESWALIRRQDQVNTNLAIFIHGFRGSYLSTWGKLPDMIQINADSDPTFSGWDYLFLGYSTKNINSYLDMSGLIVTQWKKASEGNRPFNQPYTKLALFGHSLGTLGIRQLLCTWSDHPPGILKATHSITLFGTPLNGSPWAWIGFELGFSIADALRPKNPQLRMLKTWTECAYGVRPWPQVTLVLGQDDKVVGNQYAELIRWPGDATAYHSTLDHGNLVKPASWQDSELIDYISKGLKDR